MAGTEKTMPMYPPIQLTALTLEQFRKATLHLPSNTVIVLSVTDEEDNSREYVAPAGLVITNTFVDEHGIMQFVLRLSEN
jgi:hypothetical protein